MILNKLIVENFRNHTRTVVDFDSLTTVFIGENGAGKTNLLEAIYALALLKPFRNLKKSVFIKENEPYAKVIAEITEAKLEIFWESYPRNRTIFKQNDLKLSTAEYLRKKNFFAVLFAPEDIFLPFAPPNQRRQFMSRILCSYSLEYFNALLDYEKILKQRNRLLQKFAKGQADQTEFAYWDKQIATLGSIITSQRSSLIAGLNSLFIDYYHNISGMKDFVEIKFNPNSQDLIKDLRDSFSRDIILGYTTKGAHRDDFLISLRSKPIIETGSRGEIRSVILSLKLAERDYLFSQTAIKPLMLFDDVFSELDNNHCQALTQIIAGSQSIITTTEIDHLNDSFGIFKIENGFINS